MFEKLDAHTLKITKTIPQKQEVITFDMTALLERKQAVLMDIAKMQKTLDEVQALIDEADNLGIVEAEGIINP